MSKIITGEGAYRPLVAEFNGFWDTPLASLPERLQELVRADRGLLPDWDRLHQSVRRLLVEQQEDQRAPSHLRTQEHEDFDREAQRQALVAERLAVDDRRRRYERAKAETTADLDTQDKNLARLDAKQAEISNKLAAIDREQAAAELQSDPAGQRTMTGTKVMPQSVTDRGPTLTTDEVCEAFDGIGLSRKKWRQRLTKDRPDWLMNCLAREGKRGHGGEQATWLILSIAKALAEGAGMVAPVPAKNLDKAFRSRPLLRPWADQWELVRRDNPALGD